MFYKLMHKRSAQKYLKSYINILCIFSISISMLSFTNIYCDSYYNYDNAVLLPMLTEGNTCDIRVENITEKEASLYSEIPYVDMIYADGNLDFYLLDTSKADSVARQISKIFNNQHDHSHEYTDNAPTIRIYYGRDQQIETDNGARIGTIIFQVILSIIGFISMVMIYSDYIKQRTTDIRTLSAIGISERQLDHLFFSEYNILYLLSVIIGVPLGGGIAFLFCKICEWVDMSQSNAIYPVFHLDILSLLMTVLAGYIVVYITYRIVLRKILKIDASYTCTESIAEFNLNKAREFYKKSDRHFDTFFAALLRKRSVLKDKAIIFLSSLIIAISLIILNTINYSLAITNSYGIRNAAAIAAWVSNASLFIMVMIYANIYSLSIIHIFTKRRMESYANPVQVLYAFGADEATVYSSFRKYTIRNILVSVGTGFALGYMLTCFIFSAANHVIYMNLWFFIGNLLIIAVYYLVYMLSMKKYFNENCRNMISEEIGGTYGST